MSRGPRWGPPRHRPPWWPENEPWPPGQWSTGPWRRGWGARRRHGMWPGFGCLFGLLGLAITGTLTVGIWALGAILGLVSAPPIVVAGGLVALFIIGMAALGIGRTVRRIAMPMDDLVDAAERIERGDYSVRVIERGPPQMRSLARAFNGMSARLADLDQRRRTFLADVAHELRTPLSVIEGQLEAIEDGLYPADAEHLAPIHEQVRTLDKLIDDLRTLALAEAGSLTLDRRPTDLGGLVEETVTAFRQTTAALVSTEMDPNLPPVAVDAARIRQVLNNLLSNAVRHLPADGWVKVAVRRGGSSDPLGSVGISVVDNGTGIAAELLPTVFDRFVKDPASPGSGLGLAIARDLVQAHGGTISAESEPDHGTTIRVTLPAA